jgi:hypothetical protein
MTVKEISPALATWQGFSFRADYIGEIEFRCGDGYSWQAALSMRLGYKQPRFGSQLH